LGNTILGNPHIDGIRFLWNRKFISLNIRTTKWECTLPKTNIAPENRLPGKGDSYWKPPFLGASS